MKVHNVHDAYCVVQMKLLAILNILISSGSHCMYEMYDVSHNEFVTDRE